MRKHITAILVLFAFTVSYSQNVGVGTTTPHSSAALDVQSPDKGLLLPRIALTAANVALPVTNPADALLVYNTATAGSGSNAVVPGFYYWNATSSRWTSLNGVSIGSTSTSLNFGNVGDCEEGCPVSGFQFVRGIQQQSTVSRFGHSLSISGNTAVIGAYQDIIGGSHKGSVHVFAYNGSTWILQQKLTAFDGATLDNFGYSVSISGNTLVVGAPNDGIGQNGSQGSAYIFSFDGASWVQQQKLTASDGAAADNFGRSLSISGNTIIVGADGDDINANPQQGSTYVFSYNGSSWIEQQKLNAFDGATDDGFGHSVNISGNSIVIGSPNDDINTNSNQGSAYIFSFNGTSWVFQQKLTASDGAPDDQLGTSVNVSGNNIVVGAPGDDIGTVTNQGSAYVYIFNGLACPSGNCWSLKTKLTSPIAGNDKFGSSVSLSGGYLLVGAPERNAAYLFQLNGGTWTFLHKITADMLAVYNFGGSVALNNKNFVVGDIAFNLNMGGAVFGKIN